MYFMPLFDMQQLQRLLITIWVVLGGPFIISLIPLKVVDPLRRFCYRLCRRGKLLQSSDSTGTGVLSFTVPQSFFTHFYITGLLLNTVLIFTAFGFACKCSHPVKHPFPSAVAQLTGIGEHFTWFAGDPVPVREKFGREAWSLVFLLLQFEIHLIRRLYECLFVSEFQPAARMNFFGYLGGVGFFVVAPLSLFSQAFSEKSFSNAFNVFLSQKWKLGGGELMESVPDIPDVSDLIANLGNIGWRPYIGAALSLYGAYRQHTFHEILAALRADNTSGSAKKYYIPRGDWFELVSCPHYLAEIIIYVGFVVITGGTSPLMYLMLGLVVANLYLNAKPSHEWYLAKFEDYPKSRRVMIPYVC